MNAENGEKYLLLLTVYKEITAERIYPSPQKNIQDKAAKQKMTIRLRIGNNIKAIYNL